ncbi:CMP deaminase family/ methyltransferase bifunctional enzyme involved in riboflavin biosynthesis and tRNA pseudouridine biosynthesis Rib2 [Schizosaccharomyces pombe]|uniref:Diaminohydroxyphosphoribosylamino-pyrimidine deaminase n=1 Tax=Schizosaccharomyces pombe (strain 972 / ATCC 24843) TaxID=284812 RepID=RIB2_SCHPO|nr:bifunctional CMP deaminase family methyltransferase/riboflavin-specific deaminase [Schizosaccharomyces pombe]P87241.1 RecName: Full=Diaminohydroxyphosphoribosylamino-pyrimidine deaminase; Short=DRAP deaminase; AltName: Full=Riboflavin-specific deaminase [Schizosaccharomyces pombe 972h-]CAB09771.1 CMP deaminase family/ methyltransferase bifunctional enzyme involved in riboflavin biosynthesis and tRNA pseudouridine biosynthesis (predicted) [Schizosaccharomyces pombe]|eukprot:NP_587822.1 bifunctional CMP deaminase family methyltransferase/riboflavin-specific deaminase [Schizosaccharomyces pombe]
MQIPEKYLSSVDNVEEETQILFALSKQKDADLGMLDSKQEQIALTIGNKPIKVKQSLQSLHQSRGSTGSVLWKTSVKVVPWLLQQSWFMNSLTPKTSILELGSGISGLAGILLSPFVGNYVASDKQLYLKKIRENLDQNNASDVEVHELDWKSTPYPKDWTFDFLDYVLFFDCIYNPHLNAHLVSCLASLAERYPGMQCLFAQELRDQETLVDFLERVRPYFEVDLIKMEEINKTSVASSTNLPPANMSLFIMKPYNHEEYMLKALNEAKKCEPTDSAFCVGAVIVQNGKIVSTGYSRERPGNTHAEECAIEKFMLKNPTDSLEGAIMYSTMEPCSKRLSKKVSCTDLIVKQKFSTVVLGSLEPDIFVKCEGVDLLKKAGIVVIEKLTFQDDCLREAVRGHPPKH